MKTLTVGDIAPLFQVNEQTVRRWCTEFAKYLSPPASPSKGSKRIFNEDDLSVFALIFAMGNDGFRYDSIHSALANGERGEIPSTSDLVPTDIKSRLELQVTALENDNNLLRELVARLETEIRMLREREPNAERMQTRIEELLGEIGFLKGKLAALETKE
jgi:DNA-binding transcriptional MerR regulator